MLNDRPNELERYVPLLRDSIRATACRMTREPSGRLPYPYIVPCAPDSPYYSSTLWDWDSWLTGIFLGQLESDSGEPGAYLAYERGSVLDFLSLCDEDGVMPICAMPEGDLKPGYPGKARTNMHKPVLAQQAAALVQRDGGRVDWIAPHFGRLRAFLTCYLTEHRDAATGLLFWQDDFAVGVDNDPAVFYRPARSCGSIYLNCLMVKELQAFGYLL